MKSFSLAAALGLAAATPAAAQTRPFDPRAYLGMISDVRIVNTAAVLR